MRVKNSKIMLIQWLLLFIISTLPVIPQMADPSYVPPFAHIMCSALYLAYTAACPMMRVKLYADIIFISYGILSITAILLVKFAGAYLITTVMSFFFIFPYMGLLYLFSYNDTILLFLSIFMILIPLTKLIKNKSGK